MLCRIISIFVCISCVCLFAENKIPETVRFNEHVRPILSDKCFHCHGPDEKHIKGKLQLHTFEGATKNLSKKEKRFAIVPGKIEESTIWKRVNTKDEDDVMPPPESHKTLSLYEKELIKKWINQGAEYEDHWAFIPIKNPPSPKTNSDWGSSPIDKFILAKLEKAGLSPVKEADKETLIRRVTFDISGLPPTLEEIDAFLNDNSKNAYEKLVDRLLKSEKYGEHMARYWLDAARYGDTHGLHLDNYRSMWPYRDWVISAFNKNMPFDQFTTEQLAGDLLPERTLENQVASGFNRCNVTTSEGGSIAEEYYVRYAVDRTSTTSTVWLGLTTGCATCHDHKFDPISTKEFYSMYGFFNNITENAMDGNKAKVPPIVYLYSDEDKKKLADLDTQIVNVNKELVPWGENSQMYKDWLSKAESGELELKKPENPYLHINFEEINSLQIPMEGTATPTAQLKSDQLNTEKHLTKGHSGNALKLDGKDFVEIGEFANFERTQGFSYGGWIKHNGLNGATLISKMDNTSYHRGWDLYFEGDKAIVHIINDWPGDALKVTTNAKVPKNKWVHVFATYDGSSTAGGIKIYFNGKNQPVRVNNKNLTKTIKSKATLNLGRRYTSSPFKGEIDEVMVFDRTLSPLEVVALYGKLPVDKILKTELAKRDKKQKDELHKFYLEYFSQGYKEVDKKLKGLQAQKKKIEDSTPTTLVMEERKTPRGAYVLERGQYDQRREKVEPDTPAFLPPFPKDAPKNRLGFAQWLLLKDHPLTSRVTINRIWQQLFGTGIVKTAEDFGSQGEWPSHPQLLDHLAYKFMNEGWDIKKMIKYMVMSSSYKQSAKVSDKAIELDPYNRLISRGPRFRLDAEMLRDNALAVSGLLIEKLGGEPVKPYQPEGVWKSVAYVGSNTSVFKQDKGEKLYRRTLYTFIKRTAPPPMMAAFDAPNREACIVRRERTNTPLQALQLMNDIQFIEAARLLATNTLKDQSDDSARIKKMFRLLTARYPKDNEMRIIKNSLQTLRQEYKTNPKQAEALLSLGEIPVDKAVDKIELAAWTLLANQLLNLDEVVTKE
ncbi:MAG: DUF1553 domain-containing protein [Lentisphaeraceae bacterium]|nr:DUF1553 domain-containing protein [Lentisphaeraceae bacterium]